MREAVYISDGSRIFPGPLGHQHDLKASRNVPVLEHRDTFQVPYEMVDVDVDNHGIVPVDKNVVSSAVFLIVFVTCFTVFPYQKNIQSVTKIQNNM